MTYTWITSNSTGTGDGVVALDRQYLYSTGDTILTNRPHIDLLFGLVPGETKDYYSIIRSLDEPNSSSLAYEIPFGKTISGFITYQKNMGTSDDDYFRIQFANPGVLGVTVAGVNTGVNSLSIYDQNNNFVNGASIGSFPFTLSTNINAGAYYVKVAGRATATSWQYAYTVSASFTTSNIIVRSGWQRQSIGTSASLDGLFALNDQTAWASGDNGTLLRTTNGGQTWNSYSTGISAYLVQIFFVDSQIGWAGTRSSPAVILKSTNGGVSWTPQASWSDLSFLHGMYFFDSNRGWITASGGNFLRTTDGGSNWTKQASAVTSATLYEVMFLNSNIGWAVGDSGTILKTTNGGTSWFSQSSGTTNTLHGLYPQDDQTVWASGSNATLLRTTNGGTTWTSVSVPGFLSTSWIWDVYFANRSIGWIVGDNGWIANTSDGGNNWIRQEPATGVTSALHRIRPSSTNVAWIVGEAGVVLKTTNGGVPVNVLPTHGLVPNDYTLFQNYPNPFNPSTAIRYTLPSRSYVKLEILNLLGQRVAELVNGEMDAGYHQVEWQTQSRVASGIYFYRLEAVASDNPQHRFVETRKMLLIR